jgi:signal transduction histidine kinase/PAS domain-containing protein
MMAKKRRTGGPVPSKTLRQRAEDTARTTPTDIMQMKADDVQRLVHELQVHQIELELQNEELREAQVALAEARDRYSDLYEFAPVGYLSVGPDGVIREANLTAAKLLARERASLIGKRLSHFVACQSQDALFLRWREALQSRVRTTCELRMSRPDAPELDVELDIVAHPVDSTTAGASQIAEVRVVLSDITERRLAETARREIEQRLALAASGAGIGMFEWNIPTGEVFGTERHALLLGFATATTTTATTATATALSQPYQRSDWMERVHPDDRPQMEANLRRAMADRTLHEAEYRVVWPDGSMHWIASRGVFEYDAQEQPEHMLGIAMDITDRKETEVALAMLSDVASMANDATDVEAAVVYALKRVSEYNGWKCGHAWLPADDDPDELLPRYVWYEKAPVRCDRLQDRVPASRLKRGDGLVGRVFASGKPEFTNDVDAHLAVCRASLSKYMGIQTACAFPVFAGEERIVGVIEFIAERHISPTERRLTYMASVGTLLGRVIERQRAEQALRELNETLRQRTRDLQRLATQLSLAEQHERSRLAKLLHDDLQQLLVAASLRLSCLAEGAQDGPRQELAKIDALLQDCQIIARDMSHQLSPPILRHGTLAEVVAWLAQWFGDKHGLTVAVDAQEAVPAVSEHLRVFFFQAVRELLFNAVKHSGSTAARVILSYYDDRLTVQVEDGGSRFDPHAVEIRLRRPEGLGLFSIRERLQALGGRLEIERTRQGGAVCRLVVPLAGATEPLAESTEPEGVEMIRCSDSRLRRVIRLLVVDDHALVREGFVSLLNRQPDLSVVGEAADGAEAIQRAEELRPDVVLMDVDMPTMDGMEATRRLVEQHADIAVIALSLHEDASLSRAMTEAGAGAYVSKRAATEELVEAIHRVCASG